MHACSFRYYPGVPVGPQEVGGGGFCWSEINEQLSAVQPQLSIPALFHVVFIYEAWAANAGCGCTIARVSDLPELRFQLL